MNPSDNLSRVNQVTTELNAVLDLFDISRNNAEITTSSGRTYKVANVVDFKRDGNWEVTQAVSKGMAKCISCGGSELKPKLLMEDDWTQITHDDHVVRVHSLSIHRFREHPETISPEELEKVAEVLLG